MKRMKLFSLFVAFGMAFAVVSPPGLPQRPEPTGPGAPGCSRARLGP